MGREKVDLYCAMLDECRSETLRVAQGVPESHRFLQLQEGKSTPAWLVGHLANTTNAIVLLWTLAREPLVSREFAKKFAPDLGGGDPVTGNPGDYPAWDEIVQTYDRVLSAAVAAVREDLTDGDLPQPPRGNMPDRLKDFCPTMASVLSRMVYHDSYHRGQIGLLSKLDASRGR